MTAMDCDVCNNLLLDVIYGDLDEARTAAVHRHVETCADCRAVHARLKRGHALASRYEPAEAPSPDDTLFAAVRASIERASAPLAPQPEVSPPADAVPGFESHPMRVPRWFRRAGEFAMRREVAMAAVFLLMVGVGLRFYQVQPLRRSVEAEGGAAPEVIPATEVPSAESPTPAAILAATPTSLSRARRRTEPEVHAPWEVALAEAEDLRARQASDQAIEAYVRAMQLAPDDETKHRVAIRYCPYVVGLRGPLGAPEPCNHTGSVPSARRSSGAHPTEDGPPPADDPGVVPGSGR